MEQLINNFENQNKSVFSCGICSNCNHKNLDIYTNPTEYEINNTPDLNSLIEEYELRDWDISEDKNLARDILNYKKRKKEEEGEYSNIDRSMSPKKIKRIVSERPTTIEELISIKDIGKKFVELYGKGILDIVIKHST